MAPLKTKVRNALDSSQFVFPDERKEPIQSRHQAKVALTTGMNGQSPARKAKIRAAVARKYPGLGKPD